MLGVSVQIKIKTIHTIIGRFIAWLVYHNFLKRQGKCIGLDVLVFLTLSLLLLLLMWLLLLLWLLLLFLLLILFYLVTIIVVNVIAVVVTEMLLLLPLLYLTRARTVMLLCG